MADKEAKKSYKYAANLASGSLWTKKGTSRDPEETFYTGTIDFGILGISQIMIFKRQKRETDKENMPDYTISLALNDSKNKENNKNERGFSNIGSLWKNEYVENGKPVQYLSGVLSAGVHGEYQVAVFNIDPISRKSDKSPDKSIRVSISRERNTKKEKKQ